MKNNFFSTWAKTKALVAFVISIRRILALGKRLRQGDPLSPFLFLLATEGFNVLMNSLSENNLFTGYKVAATLWWCLVSNLQMIL
jgi:hypothetical protein